MTAKEIINFQSYKKTPSNRPVVDAGMTVFDVLPRLLDSPDHELTVSEDGEAIGIIDQASLLEGLSRMITPRDDCSIVTVECTPEEYSASVLAHAVEDTDAHLVDLFSAPTDNGKLRVTLRIRHSDPTSAVRSLERYDYEVVEAYSASSSGAMEISADRLLALQALMNV